MHGSCNCMRARERKNMCVCACVWVCEGGERNARFVLLYERESVCVCEGGERRSNVRFL